MRLLLDECVNRRFKKEFPSYDIVHVSDVALDTLKNGALLREANTRFEVLLTIDKNMRFRSSLKGLKLAVFVIEARNNSITELRGFVEDIEAALEKIEPGTFRLVVRRS